MNESLYDISNELAVIQDELVLGELTNELEVKLDSLSLSFNNKVEGLTKWTINLEGQEAALEAEIARLQARKKGRENLRERLKKYILESMLKTDRTKLEFDNFTITAQKNPPSAEAVDTTKTPARFITIIPEQKVPDKKGILDALKKGEAVDGWKVAETKHHLRIR